MKLFCANTSQLFAKTSIIDFWLDSKYASDNYQNKTEKCQSPLSHSFLWKHVCEPSRDFFIWKHTRNGSQIFRCSFEKKFQKGNSLLKLDLGKPLKKIKLDKNMKMFIHDAAVKVTIFTQVRGGTFKLTFTLVAEYRNFAAPFTHIINVKILLTCIHHQLSLNSQRKHILGVLVFTFSYC